MASEVTIGPFNPDSQLILDQPFLRVPYELSRKNFKASQRHVEKARDDVLASLKSSMGSSTPEADLDSMIARMEGLKRKLTVCHDEERALHRASRARIQHMNDLHSINTLSDVKFEEWSKVRLNRLLVDYLLRSGYADSAQALAKAEHIEDLVDINAFINCERIRASLEAGRTNEALVWCADNKQALKKLDSQLEFELRLQQYIELVRSQHFPSLIAATTHARKYLHPSSAAVEAAALLAYPPNTPIEPYATLYAPKRWEYLAALFVTTHHSMLSLPAEPALHAALSAGLSALKTPACHSKHLSSSSNANTASGASVCPICSTELNDLARDVRYANHSKSMVENDPVVLPNGRVYGRERLEAFQIKMPVVTPGMIRDPSEPEMIFSESLVKKVYIS